MIGVISLLIFVAFGLHLNPSKTDQQLKTQIRYFRLLFYISISVCIPALIAYTFGDISEYDYILFHPVIMYLVGTIYSIGLQFHVYGKLSYDHAK